MKNLNKTLVMALSCTLLICLSGCSSTSKKGHKRVEDIKFTNFEQVKIPNEAPIIARMIMTVQPELDINSRNRYASDIANAAKSYKIPPQIIVALIDTECNFNYKTVSSTGDLSLGQINVDVWNIEFKRMGIPLIKKSLLVKEDQSYAMKVMAQILSILKNRHAKKDPRWYARYHSNTTKYKVSYLEKIEIRMRMLIKDQAIAMR